MADSPAFADRFREMALAAETLDRRMAQAVVDGSAALQAEARALRDGIERSIGRTVLIAGAGLLIGFAVSLLVIHHAVARPLRALSATALGILGGDRTRAVPSLRRRDEIGDIAGAVQRLKEKERRWMSVVKAFLENVQRLLEAKKKEEEEKKRKDEAMVARGKRK